MSGRTTHRAGDPVGELAGQLGGHPGQPRVHQPLVRVDQRLMRVDSAPQGRVRRRELLLQAGRAGPRPRPAAPSPPAAGRGPRPARLPQSGPRPAAPPGRPAAPAGCWAAAARHAAGAVRRRLPQAARVASRPGSPASASARCRSVAAPLGGAGPPAASAAPARAVPAPPVPPRRARPRPAWPRPGSRPASRRRPRPPVRLGLARRAAAGPVRRAGPGEPPGPLLVRTPGALVLAQPGQRLVRLVIAADCRFACSQAAARASDGRWPTSSPSAVTARCAARSAPISLSWVARSAGGRAS